MPTTRFTAAHALGCRSGRVERIGTLLAMPVAGMTVLTGGSRALSALKPLHSFIHKHHTIAHAEVMGPHQTSNGVNI